MHPQALKLDVVSRPGQRYDAIMLLDTAAEFVVEELEVGLIEVSQPIGLRLDTTQIRLVDHPELRHSTHASSHPAMHREAGRSASRANQACSTLDPTSDPSLLRRLCRLYAADYVCFGFQLPALCTEVNRSVAG
mmetsp:Transcript_72747/g.144537  ORF Transcript_72747/g.144537 Transcript_72747/m.144537 type:complete len:134 (+) Transcript_72747:753-1154(+)